MSKLMDNLERIGSLSLAVNIEEDIFTPIREFLPYTYGHIKKEILAYEALKEGIAWRKNEYKKMLDSNKDEEGVELTKNRRMVIDNLYNMMIALEDYYVEKSVPNETKTSTEHKENEDRIEDRLSDEWVDFINE